DWEPEWVEYTYPLRATTGMLVRDAEDEVLYAQAADIPLYYLPLPDPRETLTNLLESLVAIPQEAFAERCYVRTFTDRQCPERVVVLAVAQGEIADSGSIPNRLASKVRPRPPRKPRPLRALIRVQGNEITLQGGTWCAILLENGQVLQILGDCPEVNIGSELLTAGRL
ncbi:MAG TPA: hypothetical protein VGM23_09160, partial [Armatimonadota bacterium]